MTVYISVDIEASGPFPPDYSTIRKEDIKKKLGVTAKHTHNALDDAEEQALIFARMLEIREAG